MRDQIDTKCIFPKGSLEDGKFLAQGLGLHTFTGWLLYQRGLKTVEEARSFLYPSLDDLQDPFLFAEMEKALERIGKAIRKRELILIYGDYDVDGITSTIILMKFLKFLDAQVNCYIPHRLKEGYGLHRDAILRAREDGVSLIVSVDNGTSAFDEVALISELGMEVIITDHHCPANGETPQALAMINPKVAWCPYPFKHLCGAGVALKLALAMGEKFCSLSQKKSYEFQELVQEIIALAGLGTISDLVPLVGENRILAKYGLQALEQVKSPGLHSLLEIAGIRDKALKPTDISFKIAPLLNAAGRMGDSEICLRLLQTSSTTEGYKLSKNLSRQNARRREICREIYQDALRKIRDEKLEKAPLWILSSQDWHSGLIGIVAARLSSESHRPVVLISLGGEMGKGSARSVYEFPIYPALQSASSHLIRFGGHMLAAGFEIDKEKVSPFKEDFGTFMEKSMEDASTDPMVYIDGEIDFDTLTPGLVREIEAFAPFGHSNHKPMLYTPSIQIVGRPRRFGSRSTHLLLYLRKNDNVFKGIALGKGNLLDGLNLNAPVAICYYPRMDKMKKGEFELEIQELLTNSER